MRSPVTEHRERPPAHVRWTARAGRPPLLLVAIALLLLLAAILSGPARSHLDGARDRPVLPDLAGGAR